MEESEPNLDEPDPSKTRGHEKDIGYIKPNGWNILSAIRLRYLVLHADAVDRWLLAYHCYFLLPVGCVLWLILLAL